MGGLFSLAHPLLTSLGWNKEYPMSMNDMNINPSGAGNVPMGAGGDSDEAIRQLNSFLRGEISAAETYRMAIDKAGKSDDNAANLGLLREIQEEHGRAAQALRDRIRELGGEPADSSGAWGAWAKFIEGTANLFGDAASLKALKEGEEHGLKDYEEGVDDIDATSAELVSNQLIPAQQRHIQLLDQLINSVAKV
jgi:bacterioferritin (cytochrome b1)